MCRMASLLSTWQPRRITLRWFGSFWRTAPARAWPLRYCTCVRVFVIVCVCVLICVYVPVLCAPLYSHTFTVCLHAFSLPRSCMVFTSVVLTTFISSPPLCLSSFYHPDPTHPESLCLFPILSVSHVLTLSTFLSFLCPSPPAPSLLPLLPRSPSLHEGLGRASLIGSVWWWRQSDLEWVTDEVCSARCLSSTTAAAVTALIYVAQPVEAIHTHIYQSGHVYTHKHVHIRR